MEIVQKISKILHDPFEMKILLNKIKDFFVALLRVLILIGVGYVILAPLIGMFVNAISSTVDAYNPMVFVLPQFPTMERFSLAFKRLDYIPTMIRDLLYTFTLLVSAATMAWLRSIFGLHPRMNRK